MKELYKFSIDKEVEKEVTEETAEGKLTKKVKVIEPINFILKRPSRIEKEEADLFYSVWLSRYTLDHGLPTQAMLTKKYADTGGALSEHEKARYAELMLEVYKKEREIKELELDKEKNASEIKVAEKEMIEARRLLIEFQTYQNSLLQNTAESKAQDKAVFWHVLFLSFYEDESPVFPGNSFEQKISRYDEMEESEESFYLELVNKLFTLWSLYYLGSARTSEEFKEFEQTLKEDSDKEE